MRATSPRIWVASRSKSARHGGSPADAVLTQAPSVGAGRERGPGGLDACLRQTAARRLRGPFHAGTDAQALLVVGDVERGRARRQRRGRARRQPRGRRSRVWCATASVRCGRARNQAGGVERARRQAPPGRCRATSGHQRTVGTGRRGPAGTPVPRALPHRRTAGPARHRGRDRASHRSCRNRQRRRASAPDAGRACGSTTSAVMPCRSSSRRSTTSPW